MELAAEIGREADLPVYVHFGQLWALPESGVNGEDADTIVERVVKLLRPGDILAHPFTRHPGGFVDSSGKVHPIIQRAIEIGLKIDVGHGSHFSYKMARKAIDAGIVPHTLGADMHGYNTKVPAPAGTPSGEHPDEENHPFMGQARFSLTQAMSSLMALGLTSGTGGAHGHEQSGAYAWPSKTRLVRLRLGVSPIFRCFTMIVAGSACGIMRRQQVIADRFLRPAFCLRAGKRFEATAPILPKAIAA